MRFCKLNGALWLFCLAPVALWAQSTVTFTAEITNCKAPDKVSLYTFEGVDFVEVLQPVSRVENTYVFELPKGEPSYYYLGSPSDQKAPILLGSEEDVLLKGSCRALDKAVHRNSPLNDSYEWLKRRMREFHNLNNQYTQRYNQAEEASIREGYKNELAKLDDQKLALLDSLRGTQPFLAKIFAINLYLSYPNYGQDFSSEIQYYTANFFKHANLKDPSYNHIAFLYESFRNYATVLSKINLTQESHQQVLDAVLLNIPDNTRASRYAYGGVLASLQKAKHPNYMYFAKQMLKKNPDMPTREKLESMMARAKSFLPGGPAPDFAQETPEGDSIRLSDLRGKVVLVDFWASWCGPCRRENPNVVKLYDKYKDQGFEVLGVSLDRKKASWEKAIEADNLGWLHVSDLKGWRNSVAQMYGVSSIPHTVLVDREGNIIQRNLRGPALAQKLAEIFGSP